MAFAEEAALKAAADRVRSRFAELPAHVVDDALDEALTRFADRPIRDFVPILVERAATQTLRATDRATLSEAMLAPVAL